MNELQRGALDTLHDLIVANQTPENPMRGEMEAYRVLEDALSAQANRPAVQLKFGPADGAGYCPVLFEPLPGTPIERLESLPEGTVFTAGERGEVVITRDESGRIVAVTRQDSEGEILEILAEA